MTHFVLSLYQRTPEIK